MHTVEGLQGLALSWAPTPPPHTHTASLSVREASAALGAGVTSAEGMVCVALGWADLSDL